MGQVASVAALPDLSQAAKDEWAALPEVVQAEVVELLTPRAGRPKVVIRRGAASAAPALDAASEEKAASEKAAAEKAQQKLAKLRKDAASLGHDGDAAERLWLGIEGKSETPPHFGVEALIDSVLSGALAVLKGSWVVALHERGGRLVRRQDLPG